MMMRQSLLRAPGFRFQGCEFARTLNPWTLRGGSDAWLCWGLRGISAWYVSVWVRGNLLGVYEPESRVGATPRGGESSSGAHLWWCVVACRIREHALAALGGPEAGCRFQPACVGRLEAGLARMMHHSTSGATPKMVNKPGMERLGNMASRVFWEVLGVVCGPLHPS